MTPGFHNRKRAVRFRVFAFVLNPFFRYDVNVIMLGVLVKSFKDVSSSAAQSFVTFLITQ